MTVNGIVEVLDTPISLKNYLESKGYLKGRVAIERNNEIVPASAYDTTTLSDSDSLLIVHFVGGG